MTLEKPFTVDHYTRAFVALHPFLSIDGYDPAEVGYGPFSIDTGGSITGQAPVSLSLNPRRFRQPGEEQQKLFSEIESLMKNSARHVSWEHIRTECGISDLASIHRALASIEAGSSSDRATAAVLDDVLRFCDREHFFFPTSGHIQPAMEGRIASILSASGASAVNVSKLFGRTNVRIPLDLLRGSDPIGHQLYSPPDIQSVSDIQLLRVPTDAIALLSDEGQFYTTVLTSDAASVDLSVYFDGFPCEAGQISAWWRKTLT